MFVILRKLSKAYELFKSWKITSKSDLFSKYSRSVSETLIEGKKGEEGGESEKPKT
jgi:hypothetical protein